MDTIKTYAELFYEFVKDRKETACNVQPEWICVPVVAGVGGCALNPGHIVCELTGSIPVMLSLFVWRAAELSSELLVHALFQPGDWADDEDTNKASVATLENLATM